MITVQAGMFRMVTFGVTAQGLSERLRSGKEAEAAVEKHLAIAVEMLYNGMDWKK